MQIVTAATTTALSFITATAAIVIRATAASVKVNFRGLGDAGLASSTAQITHQICYFSFFLLTNPN